MFLLAAQRMNKGLSRLRQVLILALRVLAVAAIIFVITRPLAGGWLGLTGGAPDTVIILLDRSASMEQQNLATGVSKRVAGLRNLAKAINDAVGTRSRLVLLDSALGKPQPLDEGRGAARSAADRGRPTPRPTSPRCCRARSITSPRTRPAARTSGCSAICSRATGTPRAGAGRRLRGAFATLQGVRFHLLSYPRSRAGRSRRDASSASRAARRARRRSCCSICASRGTRSIRSRSKCRCASSSMAPRPR